ncbi:MAG: O-antigen ligase family protein [Gemmatimonadetes bacterium]|nr:O-antigen ligase family protein [Gemmatimonadota bacterium]
MSAVHTPPVPLGAPTAMPWPPRQAPAAAPALPTSGRRVPATTVIVVGLFGAATLAMLAGAGGRPASIAFAAIAALAALVLHQSDPVSYVNFTFWLWFISPFVRRVLDWHHGWNATSPVLLAPQVAALLAVITLARNLKELRGILFAPYLLVLAALGYGYMVGLVTVGAIPATYALLTWLAPALFGLQLAVMWRRYPELRASILRTFHVALPLLAAYGIYQFVRLPVWDATWMRNADMRSIGSPLPFLVRVFGTLNTPGPYAAVLLTGTLLILPYRGWLRYPAIALALVALLLTRTRSAWIAFILGVVVSQLSQPLGRIPKRTITLLAVSLMALPLAATPQFRNTILPRLNTLTNLRQDNSFVKRVEFSQETASSIVESAEGSGLGSTGGAIKLRGNQGVRSLDNGFLEVFYVFGWPGGTLFFLGISGLILQSARYFEARNDSFANAIRATAVALVSILPVGDVFTGPTGLLIWSMIGLGIGAHAFHLTTGSALRSQRFRLAASQREAMLAARADVAPPLAGAGIDGK